MLVRDGTCIDCETRLCSVPVQRAVACCEASDISTQGKYLSWWSTSDRLYGDRISLSIPRLSSRYWLYLLNRHRRNQPVACNVMAPYLLASISTSSTLCVVFFTSTALVITQQRMGCVGLS